jgi:type II secretory pathway pseudopilin PulG
MKTSGQNERAFTRLELIVTLSVLALVGGLALLPLLTKATRAAKLQRCQDNLRQIGQGWIQFEADHETAEQNTVHRTALWPWMIPVDQGGTRNLTNAWHHFLVLSNYSMNPTVMACPSDDGRRRIASWTNAAREKTGAASHPGTSYFVGLDAEWNRPTTLLAGDYDLAGLVPNQGCRNMTFLVAAGLSRNAARLGELQWTNRIHKRGEGNILLQDGSVRTGTTRIFNQVLEQNAYSSFGHHILPPSPP